jgi:hypothetical protein
MAILLQGLLAGRVGLVAQPVDSPIVFDLPPDAANRKTFIPANRASVVVRHTSVAVFALLGTPIRVY